jgi:lysyl endopeptidase
MRTRLTAILVVLLAIPAMAKMSEPPKSFTLRDKPQEQVQVKVLPGIDVQKLLAEDRERGKNSRQPTPQRFAIAADVSFTPDNSGTWTKLADGRIWRLAIQSPGAVSMNLGITRFSLPEGAKLWIYSGKRQDVNGPYTQRQRSHLGSLWTPVVRGDEIIIELFVPTGTAKPIVEISKVNRGYRGFAKDNIPGGGGEGACEIDVACPQASPWGDQINAVGVYTLNGTAQCSGALVNDTAVDFTPYFLSANHCSVTTVNDATVVVYWNFQSPNCGDHGGGSIADNQSGSTFRASYAPSDVLLFELDAKPDASYNVFHAGWDATGTTPPSTVCIHHPSCDVKSISFSDNAPESTAYYSDTPILSGDHWRVVWDNGTTDAEGVTEPGSSGSPLFETTNRRIIGQLHGGPSSCGAADTDLHDFYGRLSVSWDGGGTPSSRLSDWLDPVPTGQLTMDGDPHIKTADGVHYDFQGAGEYVALREADGSEIQTRQTPVATTFFPGPNPYTGIATCVSLNTAVAARVNDHRVTIQPNISGVPDPSGMQVRIDGTLQNVGPGGLSLGPGGRILKSVSAAYEVEFPNGTQLFVTPLFWSSQGKWYLNVDTYRGSSTRSMGGMSSGASGSRAGGLMGPIAPGSWLPALSDGTTVGPKAATVPQRYDQLYHKFGDSWRVKQADSLFDYSAGTSTATFTMKSWPLTQPPCVVPHNEPAKPLDIATAEKYCAEVTDRQMKANCIFDVRVTGEPGFAKLYMTTQKINAGVTTTAVTDMRNPTRVDEAAVFVATVALRTSSSKGASTGVLQFTLDGHNATDPIKLDGAHATWRTSALKPGRHTIGAAYTPAAGSPYLGSRSVDVVHVVGGGGTVTISDLPLQAGNETTPCPEPGTTYSRADVTSVPYLLAAIGVLDKQCSLNEPGLIATSVTFVRCAKDPRGTGFGPNATVNITCGK